MTKRGGSRITNVISGRVIIIFIIGLLYIGITKLFKHILILICIL